MTVIGPGLVVLAAEEDDPGDLLLEEQVDVGGLGRPGGGARAEDGRDPSP